MNALSVQDVLALPTAQDWRRYVEGDYVRFSHPNNGGCMLIDIPTQTVMVFNSRHPSVFEISKEITFQLKYSQGIPLSSRLLQAEKNALFNNIKDPRYSADPVNLFPYLMASAGIVELIGALGPAFALIDTPEHLAEFEQVVSELEKAHDDRQQLLLNKLQLLTGIYVHEDDKMLLLGTNIAGQYYDWKEAWVGTKPTTLAEFGDRFEYRTLRCNHCDWQYSTVYSHGNEGDRICNLHFAWEQHHEAYPLCHGQVEGH